MCKTERLCIRRFVPEDAQDLYAYLSDPDVVRFEPYEPFSWEGCVLEAMRRAEDESFWAVCLLDGGKLIGNLYFHRQEFDTWELGYVFNAAYQGRGYAYESARALIDHAFAQWNARRIIAMCCASNLRSWRLLERLGLRREGHFIKKIAFEKDVEGNPVWLDTYAYAILKDEWRMR